MRSGANARPFDYVVFDIGNVLIATNTIWSKAVAASGLEARNTANLAQSIFDIPAFALHEAGKISPEEYFSALQELLGLDSPAAAKEVHINILGDEFEGSLAVVQELKARHIPTACLSNNNPTHWEIFNTTDRYPSFKELDFPTASFQLGAYKPDPKIFKAFEALRGWSPERICFIEDNRKNAESAQQQGWQSHVVDPLQPMEPQLRAILRL